MTARQLIELMDAHTPALVLFARQLCESSEDVVQDAFCKLAALSTPPDDPAAWLFRVVRNRALDVAKAERRRRRHENAASARAPWFHESQFDGLDADAAVEALSALPVEQREVIVLKLWSGLTFEQIAAACGCSLSTAHRRYETGIETLRDRLLGPVFGSGYFQESR
jgi:RNA polymerase sigma factor (sigma-70 family)